MNERAVADVASGGPSNRPHTGHHQHAHDGGAHATIRSACDNWLVADLKGGDAGVGTHDIALTVYAFGLRSL